MEYKLSGNQSAGGDGVTLQNQVLPKLEHFQYLVLNSKQGWEIYGVCNTEYKLDGLIDKVLRECCVAAQYLPS